MLTRLIIKVFGNAYKYRNHDVVYLKLKKIICQLHTSIKCDTLSEMLIQNSRKITIVLFLTIVKTKHRTIMPTIKRAFIILSVCRTYRRAETFKNIKV